MKKLLKKSQEHLRELLRSENPKEYLLKNRKAIMELYNNAHDRLNSPQLITVEIEDSNGNTDMSFQFEYTGEEMLKVINEDNCSLADTDGDYIYDTDAILYRIQRL